MQLLEHGDEKVFHAYLFRRVYRNPQDFRPHLLHQIREKLVLRRLPVLFINGEHRDEKASAIERRKGLVRNVVLSTNQRLFSSRDLLPAEQIQQMNISWFSG